MPAFGTFDLVIGGEQQDGTPENKARLYLRSQGTGILRDDAGNEFKFPSKFAKTGGEGISLPYTLTLFTDSTSGNSTTIGYEGYVADDLEQRPFSFAAPQAGTTVNLVDLTDDVVIPIADAQQFRDEAEAARDEAVAAADAIPTINDLNVRDFGALGDGATDDTAAIQATINAAVTAGARVRIPAGTYMCAGVDLPDFTATEGPTSINRPLSIIGDGAAATILRLNDPTAPYLIGHPSAGGTTLRGQNSYQSLGGMSLYGPGDATKNVPVLALSNSYKGRFYDLHIEACSGGPAIWNYSHDKGGSQGNVFERISTYKGEWIGTPGGNTVYDITRLRARSVRYLLQNDGPHDSVGKANDTLLHDCHVYDALIGVIDTRGHGASSYPSTTFPSGGGADNLRVDNCFFAAQGPRKMETGVLSAATSTTVVSLRTTAGEFANDSTDIFKDCVLRLKDPATGIWHSRWIDGYAAGSRTVTVSAAFPFTPAASNEYRVQYSDSTARAAGWDPKVEPHALLWQPWGYRARMTDCRFEEIRSVIATVEGNRDVVVEFPYEVANDVQYGMRTDGTAWRPRVWIADRPRGSTTAPVELQVPTLALSNPDDETGARALVSHFINDTTVTISNGSVCSIKSSDPGKLGASGTSQQQHVVIYNPGVSSWAQGERCTAALSGIVQVKINVGCAVGDLLVPAATGNQATVVASGSMTTADLGRALGKALQTAGAGALVWCKLR